MKLSGYKKLIILGVILLIIAGLFVVVLKGVNVSLYLHQHESIIVKLGKEIELKDVGEICKNTFNNKKYIVKNVEMFNDSVDIIVESITDEEKESLINNLNEKYQTNLTSDDLTIRTDSNVRIRDIVIPFIMPIIICAIIIGVLYSLIYRNKNIIVKYLKTLVIIVISEAVIASVIAIVRIPLSQSIITIMVFIAIAQMMYYMNKNK